MKLNKIKSFAKNIRKNIIFTAYKAGAKSAHIGGALSCADIMAVLYSDILQFKKKAKLNYISRRSDVEKNCNSWGNEKVCKPSENCGKSLEKMEICVAAPVWGSVGR